MWGWQPSVTELPPPGACSPTVLDRVETRAGCLHSWAPALPSHPTHACTLTQYTRMHAHTHTYMHTRTHTHTCTHMHARTRMHTHRCTYIHTSRAPGPPPSPCSFLSHPTPTQLLPTTCLAHLCCALLILCLLCSAPVCCAVLYRAVLCGASWHQSTTIRFMIFGMYSLVVTLMCLGRLHSRHWSLCRRETCMDSLLLQCVSHAEWCACVRAYTCTSRRARGKGSTTATTGSGCHCG